MPAGCEADSMTAYLPNSYMSKFFNGLFVAAALLLAACAGTPGGNPYNIYVQEETPLYEYGPRQTMPPEITLSKGTRVRIIAGSGDYVMVETMHGDKGYVASSDLKFYDPANARGPGETAY